MNVDELIEQLIEREGGYVNHSADRGGPTRFGITEAVARAHGYAGAMVDLPRDEGAAIYRRLYWLRPRFDQVAERAPRAAAELFDTGVNMGPAVAATFLQRALTALNRGGKDFGNYILYLARLAMDNQTGQAGATLSAPRLEPPERFVELGLELLAEAYGEAANPAYQDRSLLCRLFRLAARYAP